MARAATRNYIVLFTGCLLFHCAGTWSLPLIDRDEPRFAEASREMWARKDFVIPYFNNQYRFDKPPLTYWFQVASYRLFGENDFAARFPTAIAAALVAVVLMAWGTRLGEGRTGCTDSAAGTDGSYNPVANASVGWWAAIIFTLCLQTFVHGKAAVADLWLVLFVTLAYWAGWELLGGNSARKYLWIFYLSLALGFLAKGPIAWTPLLTIAIARKYCSRGPWPRPVVENWRGSPEMIAQPRPATAATATTAATASSFYFVPGILLTLAVVCAWGIPALIRTHGEFFSVGIGKHVIGRSLATMEGHGAKSFGLYLALLPFYFVTVFASFFPWSIKLPALWKDLRRRRDASDSYLLIGALVVFGIFTLVKTKLPHYTLPAFPLIALLMARRAEQLRLTRPLVWCTAAALVAIAFFVPPVVARLMPSYALAQDSRPELRRDMEFGAIEYAEPSLVWYFRREVAGFMTPLPDKNAADYLSKPGPRFLILPTDSVIRLFPQPDPTWRRYRARGWNLAKGARVDVTMLLKNQ
jgi:4-amino-4-deoxy-L-arabinose transferase-like glycosyltransferase